MRRAALALGAALALAGAAALAYIPPADRIARTVADANRVHGRAQPLALKIVVRGEGDTQLASGMLVSDPNGTARLELAHANGFLERQLRRGKSLEASRDRAPLADPRDAIGGRDVRERRGAAERERSPERQRRASQTPPRSVERPA